MNMSHQITKRLAWLLILLAALSFATGTLAESGTTFSWLNYTINVALVTADPKVVDHRDTPSGGKMIMVKLACADGTIKTEDIKEHSFAFRLLTENGKEYKAEVWRVRGLEFPEGGGFPKIREEQDAFELLFFISGKADSDTAGVKLKVPGEAEGEYTIVDLENAPREEVTENPS